MKTLTYSIQINKPRDVVFATMLDKAAYTQWAAAWGEGMAYEGEWKVGAHVSFFDTTQGGTKAIIEAIEPNEYIKMQHVAMVNPERVEIELTDEMMQKWIGSREEYYFKEDADGVTTLEVVMVADEVFEEMMEAWPKALMLLKEVCESA